MNDDQPGQNSNTPSMMPSGRAAAQLCDSPADCWVQLPDGREYGPLTLREVSLLQTQGHIPVTSFMRRENGSWQPIGIGSMPVASVLSGVSELTVELPSGPPVIKAKHSAPVGSAPEPVSDLQSLFGHVTSHAESYRQERDLEKKGAERQVQILVTIVGVVAAVICFLFLIVAFPGQDLGRFQPVGKLIVMCIGVGAAWLLPAFYRSLRHR